MKICKLSQHHIREQLLNKGFTLAVKDANQVLKYIQIIPELKEYQNRTTSSKLSCGAKPSVTVWRPHAANDQLSSCCGLKDGLPVLELHPTQRAGN
jgi:hypothetical protein